MESLNKIEGIKDPVINKPNIKDNWLKVDKTCPTCGQVTEKAKGITKQSMKRLFSFNWKSPQEWVWIAIVLGLCFVAWAYKHDMAAYNDFKANQIGYCTQLLNNVNAYENEQGLEGVYENGLGLNITGIGNENTTNPWNTP